MLSEAVEKGRETGLLLFPFLFHYAGLLLPSCIRSPVSSGSRTHCSFAVSHSGRLPNNKSFLFHNLDDLIYMLFTDFVCCSFYHNTDDRFGSAFSDEYATLAAQGCSYFLYCLLYRRIFTRCFFVCHADILQQLRIDFYIFTQFGMRNRSVRPERLHGLAIIQNKHSVFTVHFPEPLL